LILLFAFRFTESSADITWPGETWQRSTPESQKLNSDKLNHLVELIKEGKEYPQVHSLLIVRGGYMVMEKYFHGYHADSLHTLQSVTKSFASALIGIALEEGKINSVRDKVLDFFPDIRPLEYMDVRKKSMALEHLLTMQTGTDYHEGYPGSPHDRLNHLATGWDRFYLNRPMKNKPGTRFQYDSGSVILLSAILKRTVGVHANGYADEALFKPLGINRTRWFMNQEGHPHTGGGLSLMPRDMARFGLLYLRNGRWQDKQVIPENWIEESFKMHVSFIGYRTGHYVGYGYLWWILEPDPNGPGHDYIYAAKGYMGQYIFVIPEHDMVVVVTGGSRNSREYRKAIDFLYDWILPSITK
jgi:CubicO group peptidase (beta-lactamase class C family)